jgi:hypothetical protein
MSAVAQTGHVGSDMPASLAQYFTK